MIKSVGPPEATVVPPLARALVRRPPLNGMHPSLTLEERVKYFFQIVDKSEALLLEEIDELRAQVHSRSPRWATGGHDGDGGESRWQDVQVYLLERRLEQATLTKLLEDDGATSTYQVDVTALESVVEAKVVAIAGPSPRDQDRRTTELESSNNQLADHVRELDAAVATLRTRLDMMPWNTTALQSSSVGQGPHAHADRGVILTATPSQRAQRQSITGVEDQRVVEQRCCADLKSLRTQLIDAKRKQDEQAETIATLRNTITAQQKTNDSLLHRLHVKDQHLRQCWTRINRLWG